MSLTLSSADLLKWREATYRSETYLWLFSFDVATGENVIFEARVNQTTFEYPLAEVTYDTVTTGTNTDVLPEYTVLFGSARGKWDLGIQRIRKAPSSTTLYIGYCSNGPIEDIGNVQLENDAYITVVAERRIWGKVPRFNDNGDFFPDYDIDFDAPNNGNYGDAYPPLANAGPGTVELLDTGETTKDILIGYKEGGDPLNYNFIAAGASIDPNDVTWDLGGGSFKAGSSTTDAQITGVFSKGLYWISRTVVDSNNNSTTAYAPIIITDKDGVYQNFEVTSESRRQEGTELSITLYDELDRDTVLPGTMAILIEYEYYDGVQEGLSTITGREHVKFVGYVSQEGFEQQADQFGNVDNVSMTLRGPYLELDRVRATSRMLVHAPSPTGWEEFNEPTLVRLAYTTLDLFSNFPTLHDLQTTSDEGGEPFSIYKLDQVTSLRDQISNIQRSIPQEAICTMLGRVIWAENQFLVPFSDRTSTEIFSLLPEDITSWRFQVRSPFKPVSLVDGNGMVASLIDQVGVLARAPADIPNQGPTFVTFGNQLVTSQDVLNARTGQYYAYINRPIEFIDIELAHPGDIDLSGAYRYQWVDISSAFPSDTIRDYALPDRAIIDEVTITRDGSLHAAKRWRVRLIPETPEFTGVTRSIVEDPTPDIIEVDYPDVTEDDINSLSLLDSAFLVCCTRDYICRSRDPGATSSVTWELLEEATDLNANGRFIAFELSEQDPKNVAFAALRDITNDEIEIYRITGMDNTAGSQTFTKVWDSTSTALSGLFTSDTQRFAFTAAGNENFEGWYLWVLNVTTSPAQFDFVRQADTGDTVQITQNVLSYTSFGTVTLGIGVGNVVSKNNGTIYLGGQGENLYKATDLGSSGSFSLVAAQTTSTLRTITGIVVSKADDTQLMATTRDSIVTDRSVLAFSGSTYSAVPITIGGNVKTTTFTTISTSVINPGTFFAAAGDNAANPAFQYFGTSTTLGSTWDITTLPTTDITDHRFLTQWEFSDADFWVTPYKAAGSTTKIYYTDDAFTTVHDITGDWSTETSSSFSYGIKCIACPES